MPLNPKINEHIDADEYTGPCLGCKHDIQIMADCRRREVGEDGYMHFPEGYCYEPEEK